MDANNYQFAVTAWGADYDDAMTYLDLWTNGTPYRGNYNDADYNALISDAKTQTDDAARLDDMLKAEKKLVEEDAVVAPVYHRGSAVLTKSMSRTRSAIRSVFRLSSSTLPSNNLLFG